MANDWKDCSLGDVIELKRGYDLPQKERLPGDVPLVSSSGFTDTHAKAMVIALVLLHEVGGLLGAVAMGPRDAEVTGDHGRLGLAIEADAPRWIRQGLSPGQYHRLAIAGQFRFALIG